MSTVAMAEKRSENSLWMLAETLWLGEGRVGQSNPMAAQMSPPKAGTQTIASGSDTLPNLHALARWMPVLSALWLLGITVLSLRMLGGLWRIDRWRRRGQVMLDQRVVELLQRLSQQLNFKCTIRCLQSDDVKVPAVIGFWQPVLLVPLGMVTGLTPQELESILAHELAHIHRRDGLANLLQTVFETLLFYHPAVWWISFVIRTERENCCDDVAVTLCGDRFALAKALLRIEEARSSQTSLVLAASGGRLLHRVRRILSTQHSPQTPKWPIGLLGVLWVSLLTGGLWLSVEAAPVSRQAKQPLPITMSDLDVLEDAILTLADETPNASLETPIASLETPLAANLAEVAQRTGLTSLNEPLQVQEAPAGDKLAVQEQTVEKLDEAEWGPLAEFSGLQSRLTMQTVQPQVGQPLVVKLELRNSGDQPTAFDPQKYTPFRVLRVDVPRPDLPPPFIGVESQTASETETLQPGETKVLWQNIDVSELFLLNEVREYEVFAEGGEWAMQTTWRDSNRLKVTLLPGDLTPRQKLMQELLKIRPDDWQLSADVHQIYLRHAPPNLKQDAVSLSIRFSGEKLPENLEIGLPMPGKDRAFTKAQIDHFGETKLGHGYLISLPRHTESLWPNYLADITRAMQVIRDSDPPPSAQDR
jgi:beta-lactamase regulating signal transducer with metallopeptidase domain